MVWRQIEEHMFVNRGVDVEVLLLTGPIDPRFKVKI